MELQSQILQSNTIKQQCDTIWYFTLFPNVLLWWKFYPKFMAYFTLVIIQRCGWASIWTRGYLLLQPYALLAHIEVWYIQIMHKISYKCIKDHLRWISSMYGLTHITYCQMVVSVHRGDYIEFLITKVRKNIVNENFWKVLWKNSIFR